MHMDDPFCTFPECMDQNIRLYTEVVNDRGRKQIYLLPENLLIEKPLEKHWD